MSVLLRRLLTPTSKRKASAIRSPYEVTARGKQDTRYVAVDAVSRQIDWAAVSRFFVVDGDEQASHACRDRRAGAQSRPDVNRRLVQRSCWIGDLTRPK